MAEREYKRLTRAGSRTALGIITVGRSSLWLGKDHLLVIDTNGYTENYKRFFFRDIQALLIRQTQRWLIWALVFGALAVVFGSILIVALTSREAVLAWVMGIITGLWLLALVGTLLPGPSCICQIRTAVQTEELPSLNRVRRARKVLARLRPFIAGAQGELPPEEIPARLQEWQALNTPMQVPPPDAARFVVDDPNAPPRIVP
jgi:hypothetical protein